MSASSCPLTLQKTLLTEEKIIGYAQGQADEGDFMTAKSILEHSCKKLDGLCTKDYPQHLQIYHQILQSKARALLGELAAIRRLRYAQNSQREIPLAGDFHTGGGRAVA